MIFISIFFNNAIEQNLFCSSSSIAKLRTLKTEPKKYSRLTPDNQEFSWQNNQLNQKLEPRQPDSPFDHEKPRSLFRHNSLINLEKRRSFLNKPNQNQDNNFRPESPEELSLEQELLNTKKQLKLLQTDDREEKKQYLPEKSSEQKIQNIARAKERQKSLPDDRKKIDEKMFAAIKNNNSNSLKNALDQGANPNATHWGLTPLHFAQNGEITKMLLDADADPNKRDQNGFLPIQNDHESVDKVRTLLNAGSETKNLENSLVDSNLRSLKIETAQKWREQHDALQRMQKEKDLDWSRSFER